MQTRGVLELEILSSDVFCIFYALQAEIECIARALLKASPFEKNFPSLVRILVFDLGEHPVSQGAPHLASPSSRSTSFDVQSDARTGAEL